MAWHRSSCHDKALQGALNLEKFRVDARNLIYRIRLRKRWLLEEADTLNARSHLPIHDEPDLLHAEQHQQTLNRIFGYLGLARATVETELVRTSKDKLADVIESYDEILRAISATNYGAYLGGNT